MLTPMAQGQSTNIISTIKWIRTSRLSIRNSFSGIVTVAVDILVVDGKHHLRGLGSGFRIKGSGFRVSGCVYSV